jgi:LPXTG-motif cell wall-anchored protein
MRRTSLFIGLASLASAGSILLASPATAYPPTGQTLTLSSYSVHQGGQDTAHGTGFDGDNAVNGYIHSVRVFVGHASTNASGAATLTFTVPTSLATGTHTFQMVGAQTGDSRSVTFTVLPAVSAAGGSGSSGSGLPFTGGNGIWAMTATGVGLVLIGGFALIGVRRRRSHSSVAA